MEVFFEEKMMNYILEVNKYPLLVKLISSMIEVGQVNDSKLVAELLR